MSDEEPEFYSDNSEEHDVENQKDKGDINCSFKNENKNVKEKREIDLTMVNANNKLIENKKKEIENKILVNIDSEEEKGKKNNESEEEEENDNDDEPNFYDEGENGTDNNEEEEENDDDNNKDKEYNNNINNDDINEKEKERNNKKKEELKRKNITIENIYEINEQFNYNKDNPVFYLKEDKAALDKYPWPLSSKQIHKSLEDLGYKINKQNIKMDHAISSLGMHDIQIELHKKVIANVKVKVTK